jgi:hypothetical protein
MYLLYITEFSPALQVLAGKVKARLGQAFLPGTVSMQNLAFRTLAMFCTLFSAQFPNILVK